MRGVFYVTICTMQQKTALDILKSGRNVYLTGAAGAGKTHVLNEYITYLRKHDIGVGITASTGIAATHLGGMTIHSWSGIGIRDYLSEYDLDAMSQQRPLVRRLENTQVLIIDEVSMLHPNTLDLVDAVCKELKRSHEPFGGMQVVLSGDFFQLPPIVRGGGEDVFADSANAWREGDFRICYLSEQHRQDDDSLLTILNDIRDGNVSEHTRALLQERIGASAPESITPTKLYTHNIDVDAHNEAELAELDGEEWVFDMTDKGRANIIAGLRKSVLAPETLKIKKGATVMFVKNSFEDGYVNGTLGKVVAFDYGYPVVEIMSGKRITATPAEWSVEENGKVLGLVEQVPLRLAWAITVHKSQGMSLDAAEIDLGKAFVPGQGYVALSRVRTLEGLILKAISETALTVHPYVLELDKHLRGNSAHWEKVVRDFSEEKIQTMHGEFIKRCGGSLKEVRIERAAPQEKVPTHLKTLALIEQGLSLEEITVTRGCTLGTVIGHLSKLANTEHKEKLLPYKPSEKELKEVAAAIKKVGNEKLTPIRSALKNKYTYDEIRLASLFLE